MSFPRDVRKTRESVYRGVLLSFSLGEVRVPFFLFFDGRLLPQCGKRNLASPVFNLLAPGLFDLEARCFERLFNELMIFPF